jgi:[protein-PII] uridylyltransferase
VWRVVAAYGAPPAEAVLRDDIVRALDGRTDIPSRLAARASERRGRVIRHAEPSVTVIPEISADATVLEVRAHDEPGLLYRLADAIGGAGVVIRSAVVETLGAEAVDVFYLVDRAGGPLPGEAVAAVVAAAGAALGEPNPERSRVI